MSRSISERQALRLIAITERAFALSVMTESFPSTGHKMALDNLKQKIRELGHLLACEEEAEHKFKNWWARKREHDYLLKKLYRSENKD
tara:strand:- start:209 stop:472 length:264 start_codon:yes stop_codon:yes gene_type:complete